MEGLNSPIKTRPSHSGSNSNDTYPVENSRRSRPTTAEYEGIDNSLFSHAISAAKCLEEAVKVDSGEQASSAAREIRSALRTLQTALDSQKRRNVADEDAAPFPKALPLSATTRDLPVPPIDKVMACLRMAQGAYGACTRLYLVDLVQGLTITKTTSLSQCPGLRS